MALKQITITDLANKGVSGMPDVPGLSTSEMQAKIEEIVRSVVIPAFNDNASNTYDKTEVAEQIAQKIIEIGAGDMAKSVYDKNNSGSVDNAENANKLNNEEASYYGTAGVEVWTNPNDAAAYSAGQIQIDQKYTHIKIIYRLYAATHIGFASIDVFSDGKTYLASGFTALDSVGVTTTLETRDFSLSAGALTVGTGYRKGFTETTGRTESTSSIIPSKIIGYER